MLCEDVTLLAISCEHMVLQYKRVDVHSQCGTV